MNTIPTLNFQEAITQAANNILKFKGRSRRSEYWWTMGLVILINIFLTPYLGFLLFFSDNTTNNPTITRYRKKCLVGRNWYNSKSIICYFTYL